MTPEWKPILSYAEEERIREALAASAASDRRGAPARVEEALLAGLRRRNRRALMLRVTAAGAIAATVFIGLWLTKPALSNPAPAPAPVNVAQLPAQPVPAPLAVVAQQAPRPAVRRRASSPQPRREEPVEFIPVGAWQAFEPIERGAIVRVRLPKSSLPGFGIPVSADRWNESLPADVVLGEDGSMRAIRLVSNVQ